MLISRRVFARHSPRTQYLMGAKIYDASPIGRRFTPDRMIVGSLSTSMAGRWAGSASYKPRRR